MSAIAHKLTHAVDGLRRLLSKDREATTIRGILQSYLNRIQELEDTAWDVIESRTLEGEGAQLDAIGRLLVCPRGELGDADYQIALRARIRMLRSGGRAYDLEDVAELSLPSGFSWLYSEAHPKTAIVEIVGALTFNPIVLLRNLVRAKPAGTRLFLTVDDSAAAWRFADADAEQDSDDEGEGEVDEDAAPGGTISNVFGRQST